RFDAEEAVDLTCEVACVGVTQQNEFKAFFLGKLGEAGDKVGHFAQIGAGIDNRQLEDGRIVPKATTLTAGIFNAAFCIQEGADHFHNLSAKGLQLLRVREFLTRQKAERFDAEAIFIQILQEGSVEQQLFSAGNVVGGI